MIPFKRLGCSGICKASVIINVLIQQYNHCMFPAMARLCRSNGCSMIVLNYLGCLLFSHVEKFNSFRMSNYKCSHARWKNVALNKNTSLKSKRVFKKNPTTRSDFFNRLHKLLIALDRLSTLPTKVRWQVMQVNISPSKQLHSRVGISTSSMYCSIQEIFFFYPADKKTPACAGVF